MTDKIDFYYRRSLGYFFAIAGGLIIVLHLFIFINSGSLSLHVLTGFFFLLFGYCRLRYPYFSYDSRRFNIYNGFGTIIRVYKFNSVNNLEVENDKICAQINGRKKKVKIAKFLIKNKDWDKLLEKITSEKEKAAC